jgi:Zn-dependent protease with chaperone function
MIFNQFKTVLLLVVMSSLLIMAGSAIGGQSGIKIAFILALLMNFISYFYSDKIVLSMYQAQHLDKHQYKWIYDIVHELTQKMGLPMPKLWIIESPMANAFATGRNPDHASVVVTTGILDILELNELRGVLAHELGHVKNRDILISTIAATIATAISYIGSMARYAAIFGGSSNDRDRRSNPFAMLLVIIFMPLAAMLLQMALSRSREYLADETGAEYSDDPLALASALEKLHYYVKEEHLDTQYDTNKASTATLFIVNPFTVQGILALFSTHPPMQERIKRLRQMHEKMVK